MRNPLSILICLLVSCYSRAGTILLNSRFFDQRDGLSTYNLSGMAEDKYGFMWIASQDGLNFFDGHSFKVFNRGGRNSIDGSDLREVIYDRMNNLVWMVYSYGGVSAIDCNTHEPVVHIPDSRLPPGFRDENGTNIHLTEEGLLLIVTQKTCVLYDYRQNKLGGLFGCNAQLPKDYKIVAASDDADYYYLFVRNSGIVCISKKSRLTEKVIRGNCLFTGKTIKKDRQIFFATDSGIFRLNGPAGYSMLIKTPRPPDCFNFDRESNLWYGLNTELRERFAPSYTKEASVQFPNIDIPQYNLSIFFNSANMLLVGGSAGLIVSNLAPAVFSRFGKDPKTKKQLTHLYDLLPSDSDVYVNDLTGLYRCNIHTGEIRFIDSSGFPYYFFRLGGNIIYNTEKGFSLITGRRADRKAIARQYPELSAINGRTLSCHVQMNDSVLVLGGEDFKGIIIWNTKRHTVKEIPPDNRQGWMDNAVNMLYKYDEQSVLVCQDKCIALYNLSNNSVRNIRLKDTQYNDTAKLYFDVLKDKDRYLVAAYGYGIIVTDESFRTLKVINAAGGLSGTGVYRMMKDRHGFVWVSTNNGLNRINLANYTCKPYFESDGLNTNSFEEMSAASLGDSLFFGGVSGFTMINPGHIAINRSTPAVYFVRYNFRGDAGDSTLVNMESDTLMVGPDVIQLSIHFEALDYMASGKTVFSYQIPEISKQWLPLGDQHFLELMRLKPGAYHLNVRVVNEDGYNGINKQLYLVFLPKWYQTWWLRSVVVLLLLGIGYLVYRLRIVQLKKEENIRRRLASDLHDDLGSTLNSVKVYANLALLDKQNNMHLLRVKEGIQESINGIRDIIWVLDDKKDLAEHLVGRIEQFARPLCEANDIKFSYTLDETLYSYKLGKEERRNLYLILKESVNNSIKYASCSKITLDISTGKERLKICLSDNGAGFDTNNVTYGNGLRNLYRRAAQIGYHAELVSVKGSGTAIYLETV